MLTHLPTALQRPLGAPDPSEVVTTTLNGTTFRAGRRTAAHLVATDEALRQTSGQWLRVIQPCYHTGVAASAGTHDGDGCLDVEVVGLSWGDGQTALRGLGWAAWHRTPAQGFEDHIHMVSLGCPGPVGVFIPGQVDDYGRHALGLKGRHDSGDDHSVFPADIAATYFDYPGYLEDNVDDATIAKIAAATAAAVVDLLANGEPAGQTLSRDELAKRTYKAAVEARDALKKP